MDCAIALVLFDGPEMPCKLQHAFLFARDAVARGGRACIVFEGNSPRWLPELADAGHALFRLFNTARDEGLIAGVCRGCAQVHGAVEAAEALGLPLLADAYGHVSLALLSAEGFEIVSL